MSLLGHLHRWSDNARQVLSINHRNLGYIYTHNQRRDFILADNKAVAKQVLSSAGVPVPETYFQVDSFYKVNHIDDELSHMEDFVVKPAQGRGGGGIMVVTGKSRHGWKTASGNEVSSKDIKRHVADIVFGNHSFDKADVALFEQRLISVDKLQELSPWGIPDVRIIAFREQLIIAMCRIPTQSSGGRANLHQGALAIGLELDSGCSTHAIYRNRLIEKHPDHGRNLIGVEMPFWPEVLNIARLCAQTIPLKYLGIDIAITTEGPCVLEVNARPGLAIQLANDRGMQPLLLAAMEEAR